MCAGRDRARLSDHGSKQDHLPKAGHVLQTYLGAPNHPYSYGQDQRWPRTRRQTRLADACPQPCLLTPLTNPSLSGSYSEQNLLSPARASQKRDPLAAVSACECALNQTKGDAGSPPGSPGSGSSLQAPGREVPNYIKLLRGLCFSPPPRPAFPPKGPTAPLCSRCPHTHPPAPSAAHCDSAACPALRPAPPPASGHSRGRRGRRKPISNPGSASCDVLPRPALRPRLLLANWWSLALSIGSSKRQESRETHPLVYHRCSARAGGASRPAPFLQPASHWLRGGPHPRCDWRRLEGTRCAQRAVRALAEQGR